METRIIKPLNIYLYVVDAQRDFMDSDGSLYIPGAEEIKPNIIKIYNVMKENNKKIIASCDAHFEESKEFIENGGDFPSHCLGGTKGAELIDGLSDIYEYGKMNIFYKDDIGLWDNEIAMEFFDESETTDVFVVVGVATDFCVKEAVYLLLKEGNYVILITDAIVGVDEENSKEFLKKCNEAKDVLLVTTENFIETVKFVESVALSCANNAVFDMSDVVVKD